MRWSPVSIVLLILLTFSLILFIPSNISSNPIVICSFHYDSGGLFLGENVSMPEAEVNIVLDPYVEKSFNLSSSFILTSDTNHTVQTAFAYPREWSFNFAKEMMNCEFDIRFNREDIDFEILTFEQVLDMYNESIINATNWDVEEWDWIAYHHFAAFNLSFIENTSAELEVYGYSPIEIATGGVNASYDFRYCVGSANSWGGVTHETLRIDVRASVSQNTVLDNGVLTWHYIDFFPEIGFTETQNQTWTSAVWKLELLPDNNNITHVGFDSHYYASWTGTQLFPTTIDWSLVLAASITGAVIIGLVIFVRRRNFGN